MWTHVYLVCLTKDREGVNQLEAEQIRSPELRILSKHPLLPFYSWSWHLDGRFRENNYTQRCGPWWPSQS